MPDLSGHTALVTGASSGIGEAIARQLAARGCDLVITARRAQRLEALAAALRDEHGAKVEVISADLASPGAAGLLYEDATAGGRRLDVLVNNAGFGIYERFLDADLERHAELLQLNVAALVELTHRFATDALGRDRRAFVLNVSSFGAWMPVPYFATYVASKAYVQAFTEALSMELRGTNVSVTSVAPGGVATEFSDVAGQKLGRLARTGLMSAERCARIAVRAMLRRRRSVVTGIANKLLVAFARVAPAGLIGWGSRRVIGEPAPRRELTAGSGDPS